MLQVSFEINCAANSARDSYILHMSPSRASVFQARSNDKMSWEHVSLTS